MSDAAFNSVAERVAALQAQRAAEGKPPLAHWRAVIESADTSPQALAARREVDREIAKARAVERIELGLDETPADAREDAA